MMGIEFTRHRNREARAVIGQSRAYGSLVTSERLRNRGSVRKEEWYREERRAGRNRKGKTITDQSRATK